MIGRYPRWYGRAMTQEWRALRMWSARRWVVAALSGVVVALVVAVPTAVIATPVFGRSIEPTWWSYPVVVITGILGGLVFATYVKQPSDTEVPGLDSDTPAEADKPSRLAVAGGVLSYLAVGCPVCNKVVLLALGASGAVTWFAPLQGFLALASIAMMGWALSVRLRGEVACPVQTAST